MNRYLELKERQQKEFSDFPMFFAFSDKQFEEGMRKFGLTVDDTDKIYKFGGTGGFYRRTDSKALIDMIERHDEEFEKAIAEDTTGDGFIFEMFDYELANHEYSYTWDIEPTLYALGLTIDQVNNNKLLLHGLNKARKDSIEYNNI